MSELLLKCVAYGILIGLGIVVWGVVACLFFVLTCVPYWISLWIYKMRFGRLDKFCEDLVEVIKTRGAAEVAGASDSVLANKVFVESGSYLKVVSGLASLCYLILYKRCGRAKAHHFALTFMDVTGESAHTFFEISEIVECACSAIQPNCQVKWASVFASVRESWCNKFRSLPGVGLLTYLEWDSFFDLMARNVDLSPFAISSDSIRFSQIEMDAIKKDLSLSVFFSFVGSELSFWSKYCAFASRTDRFVRGVKCQLWH